MILIVDDERRYIDQYKLELVLCGYNDQVRLETNVDAALEFAEGNLAGIQLLILDIMMPSGQSFKGTNTDSGLRTGVQFYERIRKQAPTLPVIILTNVGDPELEARFERETYCWFMKKTNYYPHEFVEEVQKIVPLP